MSRVYVVEDDAAVCSELCTLLVRAGYEVLCPDRFDALAPDILAAEPDIVLLDLNLPVQDGRDVARQVRASSTVPIIVVTSRATDFDEVECMRIGADDFIAKPYNGQVLLAHIDAVLRRTARNLVQRTIEVRGLELDLVRGTVTYEGQSTELTKNELRILDQLMRARGAIVSRSELMEALWDTFDFIDDNTLTVNISHLRQKLAGIGARDVIVTHRGQGYALRATEPRA